EAVYAVGEYLEEAVQDLVPLFWVELLGRSIEPFTSANSTVTCLRSPSRALREIRIFSARCLGVYERGSGRDVALAGATGCPQPGQKGIPAGFVLPQREHVCVTWSGLPQ